MKKAFQRTCIGCNEKRNKYNLIRIVKNKKGEAVIDKTGKTDGRGAYICNNIECLKKAEKINRLERVLKLKIDQKIYENIRGVIIDNENKEKNNN